MEGVADGVERIGVADLAGGLHAVLAEALDDLGQAHLGVADGLVGVGDPVGQAGRVQCRRDDHHLGVVVGIGACLQLRVERGTRTGPIGDYEDAMCVDHPPMVADRPYTPENAAFPNAEPLVRHAAG